MTNNQTFALALTDRVVAMVVIALLVYFGATHWDWDVKGEAGVTGGLWMAFLAREYAPAILAKLKEPATTE